VNKNTCIFVKGFVVSRKSKSLCVR